MKTQFIKFTVLAWLCLTVILYGCKKEEEKKEETPVVDTTPAVAFLKVGNQHKYDLKRTNAPADTGYTTFPEALVMKVDSLTNGVYKAKITVTLGPMVIKDSMYLKKDKDGIWSKDFIKNNFYLVVKSNPAIGDESMHYEKNDSGKTDTIYSKVVAVGKSVSTSAENFTCVQLKERKGKANNDIEFDQSYIDLKIGLIMVESYMNNGANTSFLSSEYKLKSKNY